MRVDLGPIGLALFHPIVTSKGELPNREIRNRLQMFIGRRPLRCEEVIASLLDTLVIAMEESASSIASRSAVTSS